MTLIPPGSGRRRPSEQEGIAVELVSGLLMIIGLFAFAYLFYAVVTNDSIKEATQGPEIPGVGLNIALQQPEGEDEEPYFELDPITGGQADLTGIRTGDRLVSIDGEDITGWSLEEVQARLEEKNVKLADEDFEIGVSFLRPKTDGTFSTEERVIPKNVAPTLGIAFLQSFGFVVPLGVILLGFMLLRLGSRLRRFDIIAARWALVTLLWLMVGLVVAAVWAFWTKGKGGLVGDQPFDYGKAVIKRHSHSCWRLSRWRFPIAG